MSGDFIITAVILAAVGFFVYKKFFKKSGDTAPMTVKAADVDSVSTQAVPTGVDGVTLSFTGLEVKPADGDRLVFKYDTPRLLELTNTPTENTLLDGQEVPVGAYEWIRVMVNMSESFVVINGTEESLTMPSGDQTGLKLVSGFRVAETGADFTIDFNLEKSLLNPGGKGWKMKPTLKLIDNLAPEEPVEEEPTV